ncbi:DGPFAETKE domain protein [Minicystis rosea]|nr:DGPFAETKE domain protein [Minicystis rosea]
MMSNGARLARLPGRAGDERAQWAAGRIGKRRSIMKFMLLAYESAADFTCRTSKDGPAYREGWTAFGAALREAGLYVAGAALREPATGATLRAPEGKRLVQDGPFADSKEQLGGYLVLEAPSLDVALEWAAKCPASKSGAVELRPVLPVGCDIEGRGKGTMFGLLAYQPPADFAVRSGPASQAYWEGWSAFGAALREAGAFVAGVGLQPAETATTLRSKDGKRLVQDGPYADTKEQLGGLFVVAAASMEEALGWAARCPAATHGAVEVRPLLTVP